LNRVPFEKDDAFHEVLGGSRVYLRPEVSTIRVSGWDNEGYLVSVDDPSANADGTDRCRVRLAGYSYADSNSPRNAF